MPKKRVADIARERGLEPAEVARRLAEAGVKLSGDAVDEAAAARALGGSRPARSKVSARRGRAAARSRCRPHPSARRGRRLRRTRRPAANASCRRLPRLAPARPRPGRAAGRRRSRRRPRRQRGRRCAPEARARELPARCLRASPGPQRSGAAAGRRRRVVIDTGAARPARDTRNQGRGRGRGGGIARTSARRPPLRRVPSRFRPGVTVKELATTLSVSTAVIRRR